jgi:AcrR family transcriptional regulator
MHRACNAFERHKAGMILSKGPTATGRPRKRKEQKRAADTRSTILDAALAEFAEKGFEAASTRAIAERAGLNQPLVLYHFGSKDGLWRAVAENSMGDFLQVLSRIVNDDASITPAAKLKHVFREMLEFSAAHRTIHHFMMHENIPDSDRLTWLVNKYLASVVQKGVSLIRAAQKSGEIIPGNPAIVYYMLLGATSTLASFGNEMRLTTDVLPANGELLDEIWTVIENMIFVGAPSRKAVAVTSSKRKRDP